MPVLVRWFIPNYIAYVQVQNAFSMDDIKQLSNELAGLMDASPESKVYTLFDLKRMTSYPINVPTIATSVRIWFKHPKVADTVFFGDMNTLTKFIIEMVSKVSPFTFKIVATQEEAQQYLVSLHPALSGEIQSAGTELN